MDISIIIVNYKTARLIRDCIISVFSHTEDASFEIIVVDNDSNDDIADILSNLKKKNIHLIKLNQNVGFGRANNEGFKIAKGRYICCLNPDTLLLNDALSIMRDYMDSHPEVGACGGNLYDVNLKPTLSYQRILPGIRWELNEFFNLKPEKLFLGKNRRFNYSGKPKNVAYVTGADLFVRSEIIRETEGYSPAYFMYFEDTDLCHRIRKAGWALHSIPNAKIQHLEGGSFNNTNNINPNHINRIADGRKNYYELNKGIISRTFSNLIYLLTILSRIAIIRNPQKRLSWKIKLDNFLNRVHRN